MLYLCTKDLLIPLDNGDFRSLDFRNKELIILIQVWEIINYKIGLALRYCSEHFKCGTNKGLIVLLGQFFKSAPHNLTIIKSTLSNDGHLINQI
jgi:hypothetical protein